ncbi:hypothetical protein BT67DRAFT_254256 [Trichocladium antarcticum]|uniref:Uncharacterized protein n=1 Tax=Trichocladium antarcticum TaxID=1450529 RepID=A0AAN6ZFH6_9PEZI|nr:hypothetical protein BT67DRAFT_254256 [Trichocladium antarcticum]
MIALANIWGPRNRYTTRIYLITLQPSLACVVAKSPVFLTDSLTLTTASCASRLPVVCQIATDLKVVVLHCMLAAYLHSDIWFHCSEFLGLHFFGSGPIQVFGLGWKFELGSKKAPREVEPSLPRTTADHSRPRQPRGGSSSRADLHFGPFFLPGHTN